MTNEQAARLRELRVSAGLSKLGLAKVIGVSHTHVAHVEDGRTGISLSLAKKWALACGGSLAEVFGSRRRAEHAAAVVDMPDDVFHAVWIATEVAGRLSAKDLDTLVTLIEAMGQRAGIELEDRPASVDVAAPTE